MPFVRRLYFPLFLLLIFFYAFRPLGGGDDFWAHAAIGRIVLDTGHIPKRTVYLWSADVPWVFHDYGSGVLYASLLRLGGPWACLWLNFALAATPFVLLWRRAKSRAGEMPSALIVLFVAAVYFSQIRWHLRPEAFTASFLTITLLFLTSENRPKWSYFAIAGMFVLWINLHGGVLLGVLTLWGAAVCELFQPTRKVQPNVTEASAVETNAEANAIEANAVETSAVEGNAPKLNEPLINAVEANAPLAEPLLVGPVAARGARPPLFALAGACSLLPLLCNPWGLSYVRVFAGTEATAKHISEWRPFWVFPVMNREAAWGLCLLLGVALLVWALDARRRLTTLGALVLLGALWIQARRQLWLTSLTCAFALAQSAPVLRGDALYARLKRQPGARLDGPMRLIGGIGTLLVLVGACFQAAPKERLSAVSSDAPFAMSRFLLTKAPKGRLFNDYEYSAALEWYLNGKRPLYIDLINAYPPELFDEWFEVAHATPKGLKVLDSKRIDVVALRPVMVTNKDEPILNLFLYLGKSKNWKLIYQGRDGRVWARKKPLGEVDGIG